LNTNLKIFKHSSFDYLECLELQKKLQQEVINNSSIEHLLLIEHLPIITLGSSGEVKEVFKNNKIKVIKSNRGGKSTYHGPGQLTVYPIIDLSKRKKDIDLYLRSLEKVIIKTLSDFKIKAKTIKNKTGIWLDEKTKIGFIGVRAKHWVTMHGFSINLTNQSLAGFKEINPCGFEDINISSIENELKSKIDQNKFISLLISNFESVFFNF